MYFLVVLWNEERCSLDRAMCPADHSRTDIQSGSNSTDDYLTGTSTWMTLGTHWEGGYLPTSEGHAATTFRGLHEASGRGLGP